jgi:iron complex transport system ATP-binding protein
MAELRVQQLRVALGDRAVVQDASLRLGAGELVALLGPNGAGKTTLLRAMLGLTSRVAGSVMLDGRDPGRLSAAQRARLLSYLPQARTLAWPVRVRDVVALGRFAHGVSLGEPRGEDARAIARALRACDLEALAQRRWDTLSGGELARTHVARALAAQAPMLFADEPTAALDPLHQYQIMSLLRDYVDAGSAALVVLHDVALAARFADRLIWIKHGQIVADGTPADTLSAARFAEVYGVRATVRRVEPDWFIAITGRV